MGHVVKSFQEMAQLPLKIELRKEIVHTLTELVEKLKESAEQLRAHIKDLTLEDKKDLVAIDIVWKGINDIVAKIDGP